MLIVFSLGVFPLSCNHPKLLLLLQLIDNFIIDDKVINIQKFLNGVVVAIEEVFDAKKFVDGARILKRLLERLRY